MYFDMKQVFSAIIFTCDRLSPRGDGLSPRKAGVSLVSAIIFTCDRLSPRGARIYRIGSLDPWSLSGHAENLRGVAPNLDILEQQASIVRQFTVVKYYVHR